MRETKQKQNAKRPNSPPHKKKMRGTYTVGPKNVLSSAQVRKNGTVSAGQYCQRIRQCVRPFFHSMRRLPIICGFKTSPSYNHYHFSASPLCLVSSLFLR